MFVPEPLPPSTLGLPFEEEVERAYVILTHEINARGKHGIAIVRRGTPEAYFNGYTFLEKGQRNTVETYLGLLNLGDESPDPKAATKFLFDRTFNYDWTDLVWRLRRRGLNVVYVY